MRINNQDFSDICRDLQRLGEQGHEHLKIVERNGFYFPKTASKPRWFEPIHYFYKPEHKRYENVAVFLPKFLTTHREQFAQEQHTLMHLESVFNSHPNLSESIRTLIKNINPFYKLDLEQTKNQTIDIMQAVNQSKKDTQEKCNAINRQVTKEIDDVKKENKRVSETSIPSHLGIALRQNQRMNDQIKFICSDGEVFADRWYLQQFSDSFFSKLVPNQWRIAPIELPNESVATINALLDLLYGAKPCVEMSLIETMKFYGLAEYFSLDKLKIHVQNSLLRGISRSPELVLEALRYYYKHMPANSLLEELLIIKLIDVFPQYSDGFKAATDFFEYWQKEKTIPDPFVYCMVGLCYTFGIGVSSNDRHAFDYFDAAVSKDFIFSKIMRGKHYINKGLFHEAIPEFLTAADKGSIYAYFCLGNYYESINRMVSGIDYYKKGAEKGESNAMCRLAKQYTLGRHIKRDLPLAIHYLNLALEQGSVYAQQNLGNFYKLGIGVKKDLAKAKMFHDQAAKQNIHKAIEKLLYDRKDTGY